MSIKKKFMIFFTKHTKIDSYVKAPEGSEPTTFWARA